MPLGNVSKILFPAVVLIFWLASEACLTASPSSFTFSFFLFRLLYNTHIYFCFCISVPTALLYSVGSLWLLQGSVCVVSVLFLISLPSSSLEPSSHDDTALLKIHPWLLLLFYNQTPTVIQTLAWGLSLISTNSLWHILCSRKIVLFTILQTHLKFSTHGSCVCIKHFPFIYLCPTKSYPFFKA